MRLLRAGCLAALLFAITTGSAEAVLEVTLETDSGTQNFTDGDSNGSVDFDATVGGILDARGTAKEVVEDNKGRVALAPFSPDPEAVFRNLSPTPETFTVTVRSRALTVPIEPPVGWDVFYNGTTDDTVDMLVDIPAHSVTAKANGGLVTMGTLTGAPITGSVVINADEHGANPSVTAADVVLVWTFTLGVNDEIRVPADGGMDGESIQVNLFSHSLKCVDKMNSDARKVADAASKSDGACLKVLGSVATTCVDATTDQKTEDKEQKLISNFAVNCDPLPGWGVNGLGCCDGGTGEGQFCVDSSTCGGGQCVEGACIAAAAENGANDLTHDLYGAAVTVSSDKTTAKCQQAVSKAAGRLFGERWKSFRNCKRDSFDSIGGDAQLKTTCLEPQPDTDLKIAKGEDKLADAVEKKCLDKGLTGLGAVFGGACSGSGDLLLAACLARQTACRFCRSANRADAIVPPEDCDLFDDLLANASCVP